MGIRKLAHFSPARTILFSMLFMIGIGTALLALPAARTVEIPFIDLFFTTTSALCVTGLFTIPLASFTMFGKIVLLCLIQIGGLGMITLTLFLFSFFMEMGMATQLMGGQLLEIDSWNNLKKILFFIFLLTIYTELIGAFCFFNILQAEYSTGEAWLLSIFQSVTSFCNAGISLMYSQSDLVPQNNFFLVTTIVLMVVGGLGFITWHELIRYFKRFFEKKRYRVSLNSKIIILYYFALIGIVTILFWLVEREHSLSTMNTIDGIINSIFHAVSFKGCGLSTTLVSHFQLATIFLIMMTAFIGCAPGSTGSGIKLTTFAISIAAIKATFFGKTSVQIRGREIPIEQVYKAISIIGLALFWIVFSTFCLLITEQGMDFLSILFENMCACTTLGFSTGITPHLSLVGKFLIMISMLIGRLGTLTFVLAIRFAKRTDAVEFAYPEERVMLG